MIGKILQALVDRRRALTRIMLGVMALLVALDFVFPSKYQRFPWDGIGGFGALYGFAACALIVVVSKALGYAVLYRPETYYDDELSDG